MPRRHLWPCLLLTVLLEQVLLEEFKGCPQYCHCSDVDRKSLEMLSYVADKHPQSAVQCDKLQDRDLYNLTHNQLAREATAVYLTHGSLTGLRNLCCFNKLKYLDASFNQITSSVTFVSFDSVVYLNLQANKLAFLQRVEFSGFPSLEFLNLDSNDIYRIDPNAFRLLQLKRLYLSNNKLKYISERTFRFTPLLEELSLSGNQLLNVHQRNFFFSKQLTVLDLSHNRIDGLETDAFFQSDKLERINLSYNNLTTVPDSLTFGLLFHLKHLDLDGNPIKYLGENSFQDISAEEISVGYTDTLQLVLASSFRNLQNLRVINLAHNPKLSYISPFAFRECPALNTLRTQFNNLSLLSDKILTSPTLQKIGLSGNPLSCECLNAGISSDRNGVMKKIIDRDKVNCTTNSGQIKSFLTASRFKNCKNQLLLLGNHSVTMSFGSAASFYCVALTPKTDSTPPVVWKFPNKREYSGALNHLTDRISVTNERLRFDFLQHEDSGKYFCSLQGSTDSYTELQLQVESANIGMFPVVASPRSVTLAWNVTLNKLSQNAHFVLEFWQNQDLTARRSRIILTTALLWRTFQITHLEPDTNYTFCLLYEYENVTFYSYCTDVTTSKAYLGMGQGMKLALLCLVLIAASFITAVCMARCVHKRFHIWQETKYRSRMAESISGQSFLSHRSSRDSLSSAAAMTYENGLNQPMSSRSSMYESLNSARSAPNSARRYPPMRDNDHEQIIMKDLAL